MKKSLIVTLIMVVTVTGCMKFSPKEVDTINKVPVEQSNTVQEKDKDKIEENKIEENKIEENKSGSNNNDTNNSGSKDVSQGEADKPDETKPNTNTNTNGNNTNTSDSNNTNNTNTVNVTDDQKAIEIVRNKIGGEKIGEGKYSTKLYGEVSIKKEGIDDKGRYIIAVRNSKTEIINWYFVDVTTGKFEIE